MATDVHLGEGADVAHAQHLHGEVPEEVDDLQGLVPQEEDEDEGRDDGTQELFQDEDLRAHRWTQTSRHDSNLCTDTRLLYQSTHCIHCH